MVWLTTNKALVRLLVLLDYTSSVWEPNTKKDTSRIEAVQRQAARFVLHMHHNTSSVDEILQLPKPPLDC